VKNLTDNYLYDSVTGERIYLGDGMLFGRGTNCDITLADEAVSSNHFKVSIAPGGRVSVTDLGSSNKTFLNGSALPPNEARILTVKDVIRVASHDFCFNAETFEKIQVESLSDNDSGMDIFLEAGDMIPGFEKGLFKEEKTSQEILESLKQSKKTLNELEETSKQLVAKLKARDELEREILSTQSLTRVVEDRLARATIKTSEEYDRLIAEHEGQVQAGLNEIKALEDRIDQIKKKIEVCHGVNRDHQQKIMSITQAKNNFEEDRKGIALARELSRRHKALDDLKLEEKIKYITTQVETESKKYRDLQASYGKELSRKPVKRKSQTT
jgi:pSer/pThr/pTyr-binding forkhead associated (FHA) protein